MAYLKEVSGMKWISNRMEKFRQVPNPYFTMHIPARSLAGVGLGLLLATWLPVWIGWIFIGVALLIAIPSVRILFRQ